MTDVVWIHSEEDLEAALAQSSKAVVKFTAEARCVPCQRFAPHYKRAASVATDINFLAVDVDSNEWAVVRYGIRSVPAVKLFEDSNFVRDVDAPQGAIPFLSDIRS